MCTRHELNLNHHQIYQWLRHNKPQLLDKYFPRKNSILSFEERIKELYDWSKENNRYPKQNSKNKEEISLGMFLIKNKEKEEIKKYREIYPLKNKKLNFDLVKKEALKYKTRTEFASKSRSAYNWMRKNKCIDEVCSHMKRYFICNETGKIYNSQHEVARELKLHQAFIGRVLNGKQKSTGGYTFKWL
jgi:hypothetical protein